MHKILVFFLLLPFCGWTQTLPQEDVEASQLIVQGKRHLEAKDYYGAIRAFNAAVDRPFNQTTTAASYLLGLSHYYAGNDYEAASIFENFVLEYPESRYFNEASFHHAQLLLSSRRSDNRRSGFEELIQLLQNGTDLDDDLKEDCKSVLKQFVFYDADPKVASTYLDLVSKELQPIFFEAVIFHLVDVGDFNIAEQRYEDWLRRGGEMTPFLQRLFDKRRRSQHGDKNLVKLGLVLPLFLQSQTVDTLDVIPQKSKLSLEFYEGFQLALEDYEEIAERNILVKIFDSQRDTNVVFGIWDSLDTFYPDLIIGDIYNQQTRILSQWSESRGIPQIIPMSPTQDLIQHKTQVFLAHPSAEQHGIAMADYAWDSLRLNRVAIWTDQRKGTEALANAFMVNFDTLGGEVIRLPVDSIYNEDSQESIRELVRSLKFQEIDGVYIPILGNEETAGLILSQMKAMEVDVKVMGAPHWWQRYANIDRELKDSYELVFSTSYMHERDKVDYRDFYQQYLKKFQYPPSDYSVQGYDMGMFVLQLLDKHDFSSSSLASEIRNHPQYNGIHIDFWFNDAQSNQFVNIGAFKGGKVVKVNVNRKVNLKEFFLQQGEQPQQNPDDFNQQN